MGKASPTEILISLVDAQKRILDAAQTRINELVKENEGLKKEVEGLRKARILKFKLPEGYLDEDPEEC